ncbi:MAG: C40 family peptidase, partial [Deltaproteobacteria bacterium]
SARKTAEELHALGVIDEYFIVGPEDYPHDNRPGRPYLRSEIVRTAKSFLNVPYRWGGTSPARGFDCSGFSMTVYHLNGLNMPRSSKAQWDVGAPIDRDQLSQGDLVFFATSGNEEVSHVGIYLGENIMIHAPGWGKRIRIDSLEEKYYRRHFVGMRSYL